MLLILCYNRVSYSKVAMCAKNCKKAMSHCEPVLSRELSCLFSSGDNTICGERKDFYDEVKLSHPMAGIDLKTSSHETYRYTHPARLGPQSPQHRAVLDSCHE